MRRYDVWAKSMKYVIGLTYYDPEDGCTYSADYAYEGPWEPFGSFYGVDALCSYFERQRWYPGRKVVNAFVPRLADLDSGNLNRAYVIVDDRGKIRDYQELAAVARKRRNRPVCKFRSEPVPNIRSHYRSDYYRAPHTRQELRDTVAYEEYVRRELYEEYPSAKIKAPRSRRKSLPTVYDDLCRGRQRSWKEHRRHQWKDVA